jgi:hypothetical protein
MKSYEEIMMQLIELQTQKFLLLKDYQATDVKEEQDLIAEKHIELDPLIEQLQWVLNL